MHARTLACLPLFALATLPLVWADPPDRVPPLPAVPRDDNELPDLAKFSPFQRVTYLSARRGAEWLWLANRPDGLFVPGQLPAVNAVIEEDNFRHQAGATLALARAARVMRSERFGVRARQAVLTLLAGTVLEAKDANARVIADVKTPAERVIASALLVLAIHELPAPGDDLLDQGEQLCQFLRKQQQKDGSITMDKADAADVRAQAPSALHAVARSRKLRPASWKPAYVAKGVEFWKGQWKEAEHADATPYVAMVVGEQAGTAKDQALVDFTHQLCATICTKQCMLDARHPLWQGGFKQAAGDVAPGVWGAANVAGLTAGYHVAREMNQSAQQITYRDAIEAHLQFLTTLQFLPTTTKHLADWYRPAVQGGFHATHEDGTLRIEYNQCAVMAMLDYLEFVAPLPSNRN